MSLSLVKPQQTELKPRIVVFGVGGAGGNAVNNMIDAGLEGVEFVVANTDAQHLSFAKTDRRVQMGPTITEGLGAGAHPEVGMNAAEESVDEIHEHLEGAHMVFITCGMGGGTGTGAAPVIAKCARDRGILTVGVVTKPFSFEGRHRLRLAEAGIAELQRYVDTLIVIPNQNLFRVANEKTTFADAFAMADQVLHSGVRSITDLMILPGLINLDFADVRAVMSEMGKAMMGTGEASGEDRALVAAQNAIANPLLDETSLKGAKAVLVNITGGMDMTLMEVDEAANAIGAEVDIDANFIFGAAFDPALEGKLRVSVVATGMDDEAAQAIEPPQPRSAAPARAPAMPQAAASYAAATRHEPLAREPLAREPLAREPLGREAPAARDMTVPTYPREPVQPAASAASPEPADDPVIRPAQPAAEPEPERVIGRIVDPSVEDVLDDEAQQGDLYFDRAPEPAPRQAARQPAPDDGLFEDREPKRGWSLFGRGRRAPTTQSYSSDPAAQAPAQQMRTTQQAQPADQPEQPQDDDDLQIPAFLRRLAN